MTDKNPNNKCPRCFGFIPNNAQPGAYMGALSRADNRTEICSDCGTEEALLLLTVPENWPVFLFDFPDEQVGAARQRATDRVALMTAPVELS